MQCHLMNKNEGHYTSKIKIIPKSDALFILQILALKIIKHYSATENEMV